MKVASPSIADLRRRKNEAQGSPTKVIEKAGDSVSSSTSSSDDEDNEERRITPSSPDENTTSAVKGKHSSHVVTRTAIQKLLTSKEEVHILHAHKILGFTALASFLYRFANIGERDGNFGPNIGTLVFIFHHLFLNVSSFVFKIPQRRIRDGGYRIWPEFRIHSLVFASRGLAFMLLIWYEQTMRVEKPYYFMDLAIVVMTMLGADYGSWLQGVLRSNTIRGTSYSDPYGTWWASEMQLGLTGLCLIGMRRYSVHLGAVMIVQCNSFLMTLRRKNVASHEVLTAIYGALLLAGLLIAVVDGDYNDCLLAGGTFGSIAVLLRMGPLHLNKYVLWTMLFCIICAVRHYTGAEIKDNRFWAGAYIVTKACGTALGLKKRKETMKMQPSPGGIQSLLVQAVLVSHVLLFSYIYYYNFIVE